MNDEQLRLEGMPDPIQAPSVDDVVDDEWVQDLLDDPDARVEDLLRGFRSTAVEPRVRDATLLHPCIATVDMLQAIADWPPSVRARAASVTDNRALLERWARSPVPYERSVVAMNPHCPADLACRLAEDPEPAVRANVACCPQLPRATRAAMGNRDPNPDVREFTRWLMTTDAGRDFVAGHRYAQAPGEAEGVVARVITYGIDHDLIPPV